MSDIDYDRISVLLSVIESSAGHSGKLNAIANAAMGELLDLNEAIRQEAISAKEVADKEAAKETADDQEAEALEEGPKVVPSSTFADNGKRRL